MEALLGKLTLELTRHFGEDVRRIDHALEVLHHALALLEETPEADGEIVKAATVTHDFGITEAEARHGRCDGPLQEQYGPALARPALERCGLKEDKIAHVLDIIAHHHSPPDAPTVEFSLLYEADWLVNARDAKSPLDDPEKIRRFIDKQFKTPAGKNRAEKIFLQQEALFQKMGKVYKPLVGAGSRREREEDFLLQCVREAKAQAAVPDFHVLDLGCGTGFHARLLAEAGYRVEALDYSEALLEEARHLTGVDLPVTYQTADLREPLAVQTPAGFLLLLGNTLSIFKDEATVAQVLANARAAAAKDARLLCQIVNYEPLLQGGEARHLTRRGEVEGRDTVLTKTLMPLTERREVLIQLAASQRTESGAWESFARPSILQPLAPEALAQAARQSGWTELGRWGNLQGEPFDSKTSSDCVLLFQAS